MDGGRLGRSRRTAAEKRVPEHFMTCLRGKRGRKPFAMMLRHALWEWFVDIRGAVLTSISPEYMLRQARAMACTILQEMADEGRFIAMPIIDAA